MIAGIEHVGGDMFESVPNGDAIFMKVNFAPSLKKFQILCDFLFIKFALFCFHSKFSFGD